MCDVLSLEIDVSDSAVNKHTVVEERGGNSNTV